MKKSVTDQQLIKKFKKGDEEAFEALIARYEEKAYRLAMRLTRSPEDAEEVLQDVFTTVFRKIDSFQGNSSFSSWFYRITVNASLMHIRKRKQGRYIHLEDLDPQYDHSVLFATPEQKSVDQNVFLGELRSALHGAIQELPEEYKIVFLLRDIDGLTSKEVGKLLKISVSAVKSRLHRSRLALRRKLAEIYREAAISSCSDNGVANMH